MFIRKEFYFVRHGQTDGNVAVAKQDHGDIPLNETGRQQATVIQPVIASLPIKTICCSPLKRAQETREIACSDLCASQLEIENLSECTAKIWLEMTQLGKGASKTLQEPVYSFMQRALKGVNEALASEGPVLIVAHGGIHWAICCFMEIDQHNWVVDNCAVVHFSIKEGGGWSAKHL
jgi:uncharacterized phosphatase